MLKISAHATTAQLSWQVQNFVAIALLEFWWEQNGIFIVIKKIVSAMGLWTEVQFCTGQSWW